MATMSKTFPLFGIFWLKIHRRPNKQNALAQKMRKGVISQKLL
jgi:hypothetical protein